MSIESLKIREGRRHSLYISHDTGSEDEAICVFLFTPDLENKEDHSHIVLNQDRAVLLRDWLNGWIEEHVVEGHVKE